MRAHEGGARWPVLGDWSRGRRRSGRELDGSCGKRRELASPSDQQREDKAHGAAAACDARGCREAGGRVGAEVVSGRQRRHEVVGAVVTDALSERTPGAVGLCGATVALGRPKSVHSVFPII
jgi:hypothetical protein